MKLNLKKGGVSGATLLLFSSCMLTPKTEAQNLITEFKPDSTLNYTVWEADTLLNSSMGGWIKLSFTPQYEAYLTTFSYDSDDLAMTEKGKWNFRDGVIGVSLQNDSLALEKDQANRLRIIYWKQYADWMQKGNTKIELNPGPLTPIRNLCGNFTSIIDQRTSMVVTRIDQVQAKVVFICKGGAELSFTGYYVNDCLILSLSQVFNNIDGYIVLRRNPSNLMDLNYYSATNEFDLQAEGILVGEYE